jgi:hypothetical protein
MPIILLPVSDSTESITRPIIHDVVRQLLEITGLSSQTNIVFPGSLEKTKQIGSAISLNGEDDPNKFAYSDKITLEVDEQYDQDRLRNEAVIGPENLLVFEDPLLKMIMKPVYSGSEVAINCRYRAANKSQADQWRNMIKTRLAQRRDINVHTLTYHYTIPDEMLYIMKEIHRMREAVAPYGDTLEEYFEAHRHPKITELTNLAGTASAWAVPETQMQVQGWFDFETPESGSREDDADTWTLAFTYKFRYSRPVQIVMTYPLVVHNQVISQRFREAPVETEEAKILAFSHSTRVLNEFYQGKKVSDYVHRIGYSIPTFDEFMPSSVPSHTLRVLTVGFTIDDTNPALFLNLKDLGIKKFTPEMLAYMEGEAPFMTKLYMSAVMLNFYRNEFNIHPTPLSVNAALDVVGTTPIVLRDVHHLRISLVSDLRLIPTQALDRLRNHGAAAIQILEALDPSLRERGFMPSLFSGDYIRKQDMDRAIHNLRPLGDNGPKMLTLQNTVQVLFVQAHTQL